MVVLLLAVASFSMIAMFVPMALSVGLMGVVYTASLWNVFGGLTFSVPVFAVLLAAASQCWESKWAWRIALVCGVIAVGCAAGMAIETYLYLWMGWHGQFGFHPLGVACVLLVGLIYVAEAAVGRKLHHRHFPEKGVCPCCGYDLRETPHRCPECGTVPPAEVVMAIFRSKGKSA